MVVDLKKKKFLHFTSLIVFYYYLNSALQETSWSVKDKLLMAAFTVTVGPADRDLVLFFLPLVRISCTFFYTAFFYLPHKIVTNTHNKIQQWAFEQSSLMCPGFHHSL